LRRAGPRRRADRSAVQGLRAGSGPQAGDEDGEISVGAYTPGRSAAPRRSARARAPESLTEIRGGAGTLCPGVWALGARVFSARGLARRAFRCSGRTRLLPTLLYDLARRSKTREIDSSAAVARVNCWHVPRKLPLVQKPAHPRRPVLDRARGTTRPLH